MTKKSLLLMAVALGSFAFAPAQTYNMNVHHTDGTTTTFETEQVTHVTFDVASQLPADAGSINMQVLDDGTIELSIDPIARAKSFKWTCNGEEVQNSSSLYYHVTTAGEYQVTGVNDEGEGKPSPLLKVTPVTEVFTIIDEEHIPDATFRNYILENVANGDSAYTNLQAAQYSGAINITSLRVGKVTGIEYFISLQEAIFTGTYLQNVDLTALTNLRKLDCKNVRYLVTLNIDGLNSLSYLDVNNSGLKAADLDLTKLPTCMKHLDIQKLGYSEINLQMFPDLEYASVYGNPVTSLDCHGMEHLQTLSAWGMGEQFTELNVEDCHSLEYLSCTYNSNLTSLSLKGCESLTELYINETGISEIDLSLVKSKIQVFNCTRSKLTKLDLTGMTALKMCQAGGTPITEAPDLSDCILLENLRLDDTQITSLDVSNCKNLQDLNAYNVTIDSIALVDMPKLYNVNLFNNKMTKITLRNLPAMQYLSIYSNQLSRIDISTINKNAKSIAVAYNNENCQIKVWPDFDMENPPYTIWKDESARYVYEFEDE